MLDDQTRFRLAPIPGETRKAAHAVYNIQNLYLIAGEQMVSLLEGVDWSLLDWDVSIPVSQLPLLSLVTIFQFAERLPDRQAAEATRSRNDWKYALHVPLEFPGLKTERLCEFRRCFRLYHDNQGVLQELVRRVSVIGFFGSGEAPVPAIHTMVETICCWSRLDNLEMVLNQALEAAAAEYPEWLRQEALPHWFSRYGRQRKRLFPSSERDTSPSTIQSLLSDANHLLLSASKAEHAILKELPEMQALERCLHKNFEIHENQTQWRTHCAGCI